MITVREDGFFFLTYTVETSGGKSISKAQVHSLSTVLIKIAAYISAMLLGPLSLRKAMLSCLYLHLCLFPALSIL